MPDWLRSRWLFVVVVCSAALLSLSLPAQAAPTTYHVVGTVSSASFPGYHVAPGVSPGAAIAGVISYNPTGDDVQGPPSEFDLTVGDLRFRSGPAGVRITSGKASGPSGASFSLQSAGLGSTVSSDPRLRDVFTLLEFHGGAGTLSLSGLAEPPGGGPAEGFGIRGNLALTLPDLAPEAGSFWLLLPGLAALTALRRRIAMG